jgi:hypothetical protein
MAPNSMQQDPLYIEYHHRARHNLPFRSSVLEIELAEAAYNAVDQCARVAINDLLNAEPPTENQWPKGHRISGANNASTNVNESGRARTISSISSMSISSLATVHPALSIAEECVSLIANLYYTCREATDSYISTLRPARRHSSCSTRYHHHPYSQSQRPGQQAHQGRSPTLMDDISTICTHLWRKARSDVLAPRREEAKAVRDMRDLYAWGEIISRVSQSEDLDGNGMEWESAMGSFDSGGGSDVWAMVGEAGNNLCEWLGNYEALLVCDGVVKELRRLKEK